MFKCVSCLGLVILTVIGASCANTSSETQTVNASQLKSQILSAFYFDENQLLKAMDENNGVSDPELKKVLTGQMLEKMISTISNLQSRDIYGQGKAHFKGLKVTLINNGFAKITGCENGNDVLVDRTNSSVLPGPNGSNPYSPTEFATFMKKEHNSWLIFEQNTQTANC
jgi:hypothetical protein